MIRSQVYLTEAERKQLHSLSHALGKSQSELIREAIDQFIMRNLKNKADKLMALQQAKGLWADRKDLSDIRESRKELDRHFPDSEE